MMIVGGLSFVVKIIAFIKERFIAQQFGIGDSLDAFYLAYLLPAFAVTVVPASFSTALIPTYLDSKKTDSKNASQIASGILLFSIVFSTLFSLLLVLGSYYLFPKIANGFTSNKIDLAFSLTLIMIPIIVISSCNNIWSAIINANGFFSLVSITPLASSISIIVVLATIGQEYGVYSLALGTLFGCIAESILLVLFMREHDFVILPKWYVNSPEIRKIANQLLPIALGTLILSSTSVIDQSTASMLDPGAISILNYSNKLVGSIISLGSISIASVFLPHFSHMVVANRWEDIKQTLITYSVLILLVTAILIVFLLYFSHTIIVYLFQGGAFTPEDVVSVSMVQSVFIWGIPGSFLGILFVRFISSVNENSVLTISAVISLCLKLVLNYLLVKIMGIKGIALSTVIVFIVSCVYLGFKSFRIISRRNLANEDCNSRKNDS